MKVMILAAGLGSRMRPLTDSVPKPLLKVGSRTLIEWHLERIVEAGIKEVVINISYLAEKIEAHLGNGSRFGLSICYSKEEQPLETAGGIYNALPLLGVSPFLVINGDVWSDFPLERLVQKAQNFHQLAHLVLVKNPQHHPYGDFFLNEQGLLQQQGEPKFTFSGLSILSPQLFSSPLCSNRLADVLRAEMIKGQVSGELYCGQWMDIGTPERLEQLNTLLSD